MGNTIRVIPLVKGDGRLGPSELCRGGEDVDDVHLLLSYVALSMGLVRLGAPEDHEIAIDLGELGVVLHGSIHEFASLRGWLLGLALLAKGATDVAPDGGTTFEEVLCLPTVERAGGFERLLEVLGARSAPTGLRPSSAVDRGHHLLPVVLSALVPLVAATLR
jgi:hypothetical protein